MSQFPNMPRPERLAEGLHVFPVRTPTLPPATHTNVYVLGADDFYVVEPASPFRDEQVALHDYLQRRIEQGHHCVGILLTHHHLDHVGGLDDLRERLGAPVLAHEETGWLLGSACRLDGLLEEGDVLRLRGAAGKKDRMIEVHHTPGHAPGHLCFVDRESGWGIVGDMVASVGTILIDPLDGDMLEYLRSLERMKGFGMRGMLPAHGGPLQQPQQVLDRFIAHRMMREAKVLEALKSAQVPSSIEELLPVTYDDVPRAIFPLAARSLESHLRKLVRESRVRSPVPGRYMLEE